MTGGGYSKEEAWNLQLQAKAQPILNDILRERLRQVEVEGWTREHDDEHDKGEMARAAAAYALWGAKDDAERARKAKSFARPICWPWAADWWKPKSRRRDLVRAAALILAEIERLDRAEPADA